MLSLDDDTNTLRINRLTDAIRDFLGQDFLDLQSLREIINDARDFRQSEYFALRYPVIRNTYSKIMVLNTAQKAILAMKGGREERMILIRDTNKVVALSVLRNPRMADQDVEIIAKMRNVSEVVLRVLGTTRAWVKNYSVVNALVHNPRTPPAISTNFVPRMNTADLKLLRRDKNVPELIRRMAQRQLEVREKRLKPRFLKK